MTVGVQLLASLVEAGDVALYFSCGLTERLFFGNEVEVFRFVDACARNYSALPKKATVSEQFPSLDLVAAEPPRFYLDQVENRYVHKRLNKALTDSSDLMKSQDTWTTVNLLTEALADVRTARIRNSLIPFSPDGVKMVYDEVIRIMKNPGEAGILLGWPTFDKMNNGLQPGDVLSVVGRISLGKSWTLLYMAMTAYRKQKKRVLFVSMEMNPLMIMQRLVSIYSGLSISHIKSGDMETEEVKLYELSAKKSKKETGALWVVDGNLTATVPDVFALASQLCADFVLVDGAYLLRHEDKRMNKFQRTDANAEEIKRRCTEQKIPVALSYQFNREAAKKQKKSKGSEKGDLEDIGLSDSIGQLSSIVLGLFEEEGVETLRRREVSILKGRGGETGSFYINWDFEKMDFTQVTKIDLSKLQFL